MPEKNIKICSEAPYKQRATSSSLMDILIYKQYSAKSTRQKGNTDYRKMKSFYKCIGFKVGYSTFFKISSQTIFSNFFTLLFVISDFNCLMEISFNVFKRSFCCNPIRISSAFIDSILANTSSCSILAESRILPS